MGRGERGEGRGEERRGKREEDKSHGTIHYELLWMDDTPEHEPRGCDSDAGIVGGDRRGLQHISVGEISAAHAAAAAAAPFADVGAGHRGGEPEQFADTVVFEYPGFDRRAGLPIAEGQRGLRAAVAAVAGQHGWPNSASRNSAVRRLLWR